MRRSITILFCMATNVRAESLAPLTTVAGLQATTVCLKEHQSESMLSSDQQALLMTIKRQLAAVGQTMIQGQSSARLFMILKNYQEQLDEMPHTKAVCATNMQLKTIMTDIKQQTQHIVLQPLIDQQVVLEQHFQTIKDPNHIITYKSYNQLLDLLSQLYMLIAQLQTIEQEWSIGFLDQSLLSLKKNLMDFEKTLIIYGQDLFKKEYPRRTTECYAVMKLWMDDLDTDAIMQKEQAVMVREQQVAPFLERTTKGDLLMPSLQRAHKEFVMSPCFHKLKTKIQKIPATDTSLLTTVVVHEGDKGKEIYVGGS